MRGIYTAAAASVVAPLSVFGPRRQLSRSRSVNHLLRRATWGPSPADRTLIDQLGLDAWVERQLAPSTIADPVSDSIAAQFNPTGTTIPQVVGSITRYSWDAQFDVAQGFLGRQVFSERQLFEVTVDVMHNLLNATTPSDSLWSCGPDYHHAVIRAHTFGTYRDMLLAAMRHPAMLTYLGNEQSTRTHVNENLGRELLELHTVGVGAYTETDVVNSARILSGRGIDWVPQTFRYQPWNHSLGAVTVMGFSDPNTDADQGLAMGDRYLAYLATHPSTAKNVARRLCLRFVSDDPSSELVARVAQAYLANDTAIVPMLRAIFTSTEFWRSAGLKTRRPNEDLVAAARAADVKATDAATAAKGIESLYWHLWDIGNPPLGWAPPNGYPEVGAAWLSSGQLLQRFTGHRAVTGNWFPGIKASAELQARPGETLDQWVSRVGRFLTGGELPTAARASIVGFFGLPGTAVALDNWVGWKAPHLAALVLDSLYHQAR